MPETNPRFRVVGEGEPPPRRRRGPGVAVLLVFLYALAFAVALWLLWREARRERAAPPPASRAAAPAPIPVSVPDRNALRTGEGMRPAARTEYLRELERDRCDCGCGRTLQDCLSSDRKCTRSPELATRLQRKLD